MSDIVTSRIFSDGEKGITATKLNQIISGSQIQPDFYNTKPTTSTIDPTDTLLDLKGSGSYAQVSGANLISSIASQINVGPQIQDLRLRNFSAVGNGSFECDQRNVGNAVAGIANGAFACDRWAIGKAGTMAISTQQTAAALPDVCIPGNNFRITRSYLRITLTTAQASLAATDNLCLTQQVEGPYWRELSNDVHSISLLVRTSVAGLKFGVALRDAATATRSLTKLCTIPSANTWTLITLPNIPVWPTAGVFSANPGSVGYQFTITLAAGTSNTNAANDTWQNNNTLGALGQSNFASNATGSTFDLAFVQHEPNSACTQLMDKPFTQNLDECLRYFQKSYDYDVALGTVAANGQYQGQQQSTNAIAGPFRFIEPMAKIPTVTCYNFQTGAINSFQFGGTNYTISSISGIGKNGFTQLISTTAMPAVTAGAMAAFHIIADTGW